MLKKGEPFVLSSVQAPTSDKTAWNGSFEEYCRIVAGHPKTIQTAHQRLFSAIESHGSRDFTRFREKVVRWNVFDDPFTPTHRNAIYGDNVALALMRFVSTIRAAALGLGQEYRMYLLRGPVGTAKSTAAALLADALEHYTATDEGQLYAPGWEIEKNDDEGKYILGTITQAFESDHRDCPLHEEPLGVLPPNIRKAVVRDLERVLNANLPVKATPVHLSVSTDTCPYCSQVFQRFLNRYNGDWKMVIEKHLRVRRIVLSETKGVGIVIVRPRDQKDQDAAEFLGDTNLNALAAYGTSADERTFDFQGYYQRANRGMFYWEEMLKFGLSFLYDLLGASMEHKVQPPRFREISTDQVILGSTNDHEFAKLRDNDAMEALRDRTISVQIPYILEVSNEVRIYQKFFTEDRRGGKHLAPHSIRLAALWAVLTRLKDPKKADGLDRLKKARLYDGQVIRGYTEDAVRELINEAGGEEGTSEAISPRFIGDRISQGFMAADNRDCVSPFLIITELRDGLKNHPHIKNKEKREQYETLLKIAQGELDEHLKDDLQGAIVGDEAAIKELWNKYIDQVNAWSTKEKILDEVTREPREPDEEFLRRIENLIEVQNHEEFRQRLVNAMNKRGHDRHRNASILPYDHTTDQELYKALRLFLFEQAKERINWETLISRKATDSTDQRRIDDIKGRLIADRGYCEVCASEVMVHAAGIFKRGKK